MTTTITKISAVLFVTVNGSNPKSYFGATGKYQFSDDNTTVQICIGLDVYNTTWQNLIVGTSTPTSVSQAKTLLNGILGT